MTPPCWSRSGGLWSQWDMMTLHAKEFVRVVHMLLSIEMELRPAWGRTNASIKTASNAWAKVIADFCTNLDLPTSVKAADTLKDIDDFKDLHRAIERMADTLFLEMDGREFYGPLSVYKKYYDQPELFGDKVFKNFHSANDDIYEAGMCLALERATACVMHLMRAQEVALRVLASALSVPDQNDWGAYLKKIEKELDTGMQAAGARSAEEQFYAEVGLNFDRLRRAWRNPTMHPEKTYSQDRAEEILLAVKSFMNHLADRLSE